MSSLRAGCAGEARGGAATARRSAAAVQPRHALGPAHLPRHRLSTFHRLARPTRKHRTYHTDPVPSSWCRGLSQKFLCGLIKKHNTTTMISLFFYTISTNVDALTCMLLFLQSCSFLQKTSSCSFCHRRKSLTDDAMTVIVTRKLCATQVFFTSLAIADIATPEMWAGAAEELHVAVFLDACFSMLHVLINQDVSTPCFKKLVTFLIF